MEKLLPCLILSICSRLPLSDLWKTRTLSKEFLKLLIEGKLKPPPAIPLNQPFPLSFLVRLRIPIGTGSKYLYKLGVCDVQGNFSADTAVVRGCIHILAMCKSLCWFFASSHGHCREDPYDLSGDDTDSDSDAENSGARTFIFNMYSGGRSRVPALPIPECFCSTYGISFELNSLFLIRVRTLSATTVADIYTNRTQGWTTRDLGEWMELDNQKAIYWQGCFFWFFWRRSASAFASRMAAFRVRDLQFRVLEFPQREEIPQMEEVPPREDSYWHLEGGCASDLFAFYYHPNDPVLCYRFRLDAQQGGIQGSWEQYQHPALAISQTLSRQESVMRYDLVNYGVYVNQNYTAIYGTWDDSTERMRIHDETGAVVNRITVPRILNTFRASELESTSRDLSRYGLVYGCWPFQNGDITWPWPNVNNTFQEPSPTRLGLL